MITRIELQNRFLKDSPDRRMGAIASDLNRLANLAKTQKADPVFSKNLFLELKLFTEWAAPDASAETQELLLGLQHSIVQWEKNGMKSLEEPRSWSLKILETTGLYNG